MKVVVVESPAKAKTINRYLGDEFKVLASYGHVCDLPSKDGSVLPDNDFDYGCRPHSDGYSHSVILCGGQEAEKGLVKWGRSWFILPLLGGLRPLRTPP